MTTLTEERRKAILFDGLYALDSHTDNERDDGLLSSMATIPGPRSSRNVYNSGIRESSEVQMVTSDQITRAAKLSRTVSAPNQVRHHSEAGNASSESTREASRRPTHKMPPPLRTSHTIAAIPSSAPEPPPSSMVNAKRRSSAKGQLTLVPEELRVFRNLHFCESNVRGE